MYRFSCAVARNFVKGRVRRRYYVAVSVGYMLVGVVILVRSAISAVFPLILLGLVFVALGLVRLRDYLGWRRLSGGS